MSFKRVKGENGQGKHKYSDLKTLIWKRLSLFKLFFMYQIYLFKLPFKLPDSLFLPPLQVSIKFSKDQGLPGSNTSFYLQAAPDSFCALRAVDKSVLLLKSEQQLSAESVSSLISSFSSGPLTLQLMFLFKMKHVKNIKYFLPLFPHELYILFFLKSRVKPLC